MKTENMKTDKTTIIAIIGLILFVLGFISFFLFGNFDHTGVLNNCKRNNDNYSINCKQIDW